MPKHFFEPGSPRHEQISDWIRSQIGEGAYVPDDQLPSESELVKQFGVSRITVRRALQTLENEGLIYRRPGLGSFVAAPKVRQGLVRLADFAQDMERAGLRASSRVLHYGQEEVPASVADFLELDPGTIVLRLDRLRLGDDLPIAFDRTWLPLFYGQLLEGHDLEQSTIYRILEEKYGIPLLGGRYRIEAAAATPDVATILNVPEGRALLVINRLSYTLGNRAIYYQRRLYRSDRIAFELELSRGEVSGPPPADGMPLRDFEPVFNLKGPRKHPG